MTYPNETIIGFLNEIQSRYEAKVKDTGKRRMELTAFYTAQSVAERDKKPTFEYAGRQWKSPVPQPALDKVSARISALSEEQGVCTTFAAQARLCANHVKTTGTIDGLGLVGYAMEGGVMAGLTLADFAKHGPSARSVSINNGAVKQAAAQTFADIPTPPVGEPYGTKAWDAFIVSFDAWQAKQGKQSDPIPAPTIDYDKPGPTILDRDTAKAQAAKEWTSMSAEEKGKWSEEGFKGYRVAVLTGRHRAR